MSLWKWNDVELEVDMEDADFLEKYEKAFDAMGLQEEKLQKTGVQSAIVKEYCNMFYRLFDDIFGEGTGERLFSGKHNVRICEECYDAFIAECRDQVQSVNKRRSVMLNKYKPNRIQRRTSGKK